MSSREAEPAPETSPIAREARRSLERRDSRALLDVATIVGVALLAHALVDMVEYTSFTLSVMAR